MAACDICLELFDSAEHTPRILQCGHSICESCLTFLQLYTAEGELSQNSPQCPKCRAPIAVQKLSQLPKNFSLLDSQVQPTALLCPLHGDLGLQALLFCLRCGVYVCHKCIATTHNAHQFEDLEKRARRIKIHISTLRSSVEQQKKRQEEQLRVYQLKKETVQQSQHLAQSSVQDYFEQLRAQIASEESQYLHEIQLLYQKDIDDIESLVQLAHTRIQLIEKVMAQWSAFEKGMEKMAEKDVLQFEDTNPELMRMKVESASVDFLPSPEYRVHQYRFREKKEKLAFGDLGEIVHEGVGEYLLFLGATNDKRDPCSGSWVLSLSSASWEPIDMEIDLRAYASACFLADYQAVVVTGGRDHNSTSRATQILYPSMRRSDNRCMMGSARAGHCSVYYHNTVYAFGGFSEDLGVLNSCEGFDFVNDHWEDLRPMQEKRSLFSACINETQIYVFGGYARRYLNSIERYSIPTDRWVTLSVSLPYSAAGTSACLYQGSIIVLGGLQGDVSFSHVYLFSGDNLQPLASLKTARAFSKCFSFHDRVLVIGGSKVFSIEELKDKEWVEFRTVGGVKSSGEKSSCVAIN